MNSAVTATRPRPRYSASIFGLSSGLLHRPTKRFTSRSVTGRCVGTFQTMVVTSLIGRGSSSMIIEAVQTRGDMRGQGIGAQMIEFAIAEAKRRGLRLVQLTSNASRTDAHRFYERLGFKQSHLGFKMALK
nr:GNAT family N-acetyltransferase [Rhizobium sp. 57MFTsu3.2]